MSTCWFQVTGAARLYDALKPSQKYLMNIKIENISYIYIYIIILSGSENTKGAGDNISLFMRMIGIYSHFMKSMEFEEYQDDMIHEILIYISYLIK